MSNSNFPSRGETQSDDERLVLTDSHRVGTPADDRRAPDQAEAPRDAVAPAGPAGDAALRALVAEIVREELRGPLGERMTRNLRKLVRREISRALAMRDAG